MGTSVIEKVNKIGAETPTTTAPSGSSIPPPSKKSNRKLANWLLGFVLSWLPVLLGPFVRLLFKDTFIEVLTSIWTDVSIIYIGVSLIVSAMNDLEPGEHGRTNIYICFMVFAAVIYAIIKASQQFAGADAISTHVIVVMNVIFLAVPLFLGLHQYMRKNGGVLR